MPDSFTPSPIRRQEVILGGTPVDLMDDELFLHELTCALRSDSRLAVASANLDHIYHFGARSRFQHQIGTGAVPWLTLLDGAPLAVRARQLTGVWWPRLAGADLIAPILRLTEAERHRVGFLGGSATMHQALQIRLAACYPTLQVAGYWAPARRELENIGTARQLATCVDQSGVDVLFVGLGKPRQELWIEQYGRLTGARVMLAFGASADFLAGTAPRAPRILRAVGMEWLYRLAREPRRLGNRYLVQGPQALRTLMVESHIAERI
jgi:exopolysaccharide biosynthesis WecB/TagA/CpsF family protein